MRPTRLETEKLTQILWCVVGNIVSSLFSWPSHNLCRISLVGIHHRLENCDVSSFKCLESNNQHQAWYKCQSLFQSLLRNGWICSLLDRPPVEDLFAARVLCMNFHNRWRHIIGALEWLGRKTKAWRIHFWKAYYCSLETIWWKHYQ